MRLNQYLAKSLGISRRKADDLIANKQIFINGTPAHFASQFSNEDTLVYKTNSSEKIISRPQEDSEIILFYKPPKVVTTASDPEGRKTVFQLLPKKYQTFKTAGRLDFLSEGLLVLSGNGKLIFALTHPKFKTNKSYLVGLDKKLSNKHFNLAASGEMELEGYQLNPVKIEPLTSNEYDFLDLNPRNNWYKFELSEGRNRQIRKMAAQFGCVVTRLIRISHGPFKISKEIYKQGFVEAKLS